MYIAANDVQYQAKLSHEVLLFLDQQLNIIVWVEIKSTVLYKLLRCTVLFSRQLL
jgi:hypothetical protein